MLGISEEQHGDRTRLFMEWQQMNWPVLIDSLNLLEVTAVPITLLIDEYGVIRFKNPNEAQLAAFLGEESPENPVTTSVIWSPELTRAIDAIYSKSAKKIDAAIQTYASIPEKSPRQWFHSGVLYRKRFDSPSAQASDFSMAVTAWGQALAGDPRQYIWRRRIQQYGPRLDKPYPFYDWVPEARKTITARGGVPPELVAEPSGAEYARPGSSTISGRTEEKLHPDPENKLPDDPDDLISVESVVVPSTDKKKPGYRIHLSFSPDAEKDAHWNNESGPMAIWWESAGEWSPPKAIQGIEVAIDAASSSATSSETRRIEFELHPAAELPLPASLKGAVFFYVCEGKTGTCQFVRKSFVIDLRPKE